MYPSSSSSSSSSQSQSQSGLIRYGSAPGSLLTTAVDAVMGHYYSQSQSGSGESTCKVNSSDPTKGVGVGSFQYQEPGFGGASPSALLRQRSSPAGFLAHLDLPLTLPHNAAAGFTITRGSGTYTYGEQGEHGNGASSSRLKSQLSFTGGQHDNLLFSSSPNKRSKNIDGDILTCLNAFDSHLDMPTMHIPEDSVPCKIRAKRGCATHPRSIAERERRTRISGKLKKLQDLVPNMDKQTSYADMLDLAVQHIKGLQGQVQKLHNELENCSCGCKQST